VRRHVGARNRAKLVPYLAVAAIILASCGSDKKSTTTVAPIGTGEPEHDRSRRHGGKRRPAAPASFVIDRDMDLTTLDLSLTYCDTCQIFNTRRLRDAHHRRPPLIPTSCCRAWRPSWEANADNTVFTFQARTRPRSSTTPRRFESKDVKFLVGAGSPT